MFASLALVGSLLLGQAAAPAPANADLQVRRLVRQLDAPQLAEREQAEAALIALGPEVLALLPRPDARSSAEVTQRLARVRQTLQRRLAEASVQASRLTLEGELPLKEIVAAITTQTGNRLTLAEPGVEDRKVAVQWRETPFWQALDEIAAKTGLAPYPYAGGEDGLVLRRVGETGTERGPQAAHAGPFRFAPTEVEASRNLRAGTNVLTVTLEVAWEPRLAAVSLVQPLATLEAEDDQRRSLVPRERQAEIEVPVMPGITAAELRIPLEPAPREARAVARIAGKVRTVVLGKMETFLFAKLDAAKPVEQRIAGATVTLEGSRKNNELWQVLIRVRYDDAGDALASHRGWIFENEAYLETAGGERIEAAAYDTTSQTENEVGVAYMFEADKLSDYAFVYKTPGMVFSTELAYEVKDIPLP